jgi:hypothetical protein
MKQPRGGSPNDRSSWTPERWAEHRRALNRELRAASLAGVEQKWWQAFGRGLTEAELQRVTEEYPGDLPTELPGTSR